MSYPQDGLIASNENMAQSEFLRITAFEYLFSILDGDDVDGAIVRAREWLRELYGENYDAVSRAMRCMRKLSDEDRDWPSEIDA
jgi:hypothetical protein